MRILIISFFIATLGYHSILPAQSHFWIFFPDKGAKAEMKLENPGSLLSPIAIGKRNTRGIPLDYFDLPVYEGYSNQINGNDIYLRVKSRWLNAVSVSTHLSANELKSRFPFALRITEVKTLTPAEYNPAGNNREEKRASQDRNLGVNDSIDYGVADRQVSMMNIPQFHSMGFRGEGVTVAVMDAGFIEADKITALQHLWTSGRVLSWFDFVDNTQSVFDDDDHGLQVLSCMAAFAPGKLVGTSPGASFLLGRTETTSSESRQEEDFWLQGMEWADSLGADVIHSSLGYSTFDNESESYSYDSLDGQTAIITRAAGIAVSRGILVTTSAGNEGFSPWHYITAPCDCEGVLCIGSVDSTGRHSYFSSVGPTFDGRLKPDVVAMGSKTAVLGRGEMVVRSDGTSYAAPLVAGLAACLIQAHPMRKGSDIKEAIRLSGDKSATPGNKFGFGIPNVIIADSILLEMDKADLNSPDNSALPAMHFRIEKVQGSPEFRIIQLSDKYSLQLISLFDQKGKSSLKNKLNPDLKEWIFPSQSKTGGKYSAAELTTKSGDTFKIHLSEL